MVIPLSCLMTPAVPGNNGFEGALEREERATPIHRTKHKTAASTGRDREQGGGWGQADQVFLYWLFKLFPYVNNGKTNQLFTQDLAFSAAGGGVMRTY